MHHFNFLISQIINIIFSDLNNIVLNFRFGLGGKSGESQLHVPVCLHWMGFPQVRYIWHVCGQCIQQPKCIFVHILHVHSKTDDVTLFWKTVRKNIFLSWAQMNRQKCKAFVCMLLSSYKWKERLSVCLSIISTTIHLIDFTLGRCIAECRVWSCVDERFSRKLRAAIPEAK